MNTNPRKVLTIGLSGGGSLKVNADNLDSLSKAVGMFSPADLNAIMRAIQTYKHCTSKLKEMEDLVNKEWYNVCIIKKQISETFPEYTLPMSSCNTERQIQFMEDFGSTIICCTPSYALNLSEAIEEKGVKDKLKLRAGIFGAEPWTEEMRKDIEKDIILKGVIRT